jgi:TRAP-type C4-dicarboxylate transport system permease large subunit
VYGAIGNVSIAGLFLGGTMPGLMIGFGFNEAAASRRSGGAIC